MASRASFRLADSSVLVTCDLIGFATFPAKPFFHRKRLGAFQWVKFKESIGYWRIFGEFWKRWAAHGLISG